jgi:hypothetical protein
VGVSSLELVREFVAIRLRAEESPSTLRVSTGDTDPSRPLLRRAELGYYCCAESEAPLFEQAGGSGEQYRMAMCTAMSQEQIDLDADCSSRLRWQRYLLASLISVNATGANEARSFCRC